MNLIEILKYWADKYSFDDEDIVALDDIVKTLEEQEDEFADEEGSNVEDFEEDYSDNEEE